MTLGLSFRQNSYYNYGTVSPNNIILHVNTYTTGSYTGAGTVWRDLSGYGNKIVINPIYKTKKYNLVYRIRRYKLNKFLYSL